MTTIKISSLKAGDIFETHSGASFKVLAEFKTVKTKTSCKRELITFYVNLSTGRNYDNNDFKNTIIFKK